MKNDDIDRLLKNSSKAELLEKLSEKLEDAGCKVIVIVVTDKAKGGYSSQVMTLGLATSYEAYGMLDVAKQDLMEDDR